MARRAGGGMASSSAAGISAFTHTFTLASASCSRSRHTPRTERTCPHAHVLAHAHAVAHAHPRLHLSHFIPRRSSSSSQPQPEVVRSLVRVWPQFYFETRKKPPNFSAARQISPAATPAAGHFRVRSVDAKKTPNLAITLRAVPSLEASYLEKKRDLG